MLWQVCFPLASLTRGFFAGRQNALDLELPYCHFFLFFGKLNFRIFCDFQKNREIIKTCEKKGFREIYLREI